MGYAGSTLQPGYTLVTPQFTAIGGGNIDAAIGLKPVGTDVDSVYIALLDEFGTAIKTYAWNSWMFEPACWADDEYQQLNTMPLEPGQSLWVQGTTTGQDLQSSGEVGTADALVKLQAGYTIGGNPFPVAIPVQDIVAEGEDVDSIYIALLNEFGTAIKTYAWNSWMFEPACWADDEYKPAEGNILAGQGLWIQGTSNKQFVRFPAPEL